MSKIIEESPAEGRAAFQAEALDIVQRHLITPLSMWDDEFLIECAAVCRKRKKIASAIAATVTYKLLETPLNLSLSVKDPSASFLQRLFARSVTFQSAEQLRIGYYAMIEQYLLEPKAQTISMFAVLAVNVARMPALGIGMTDLSALASVVAWDTYTTINEYVMLRERVRLAELIG